jgi:multiple sugar transport system substrate-binding protein
MIRLNTHRWSGRPLIAMSLAVAMLGSTAQTSYAQDVIELDFWDQTWGPPVYVEVAQGLVDEFNASQSEIHVNYRSIPWANWYETYVTAIASGSAPDISTGGGFQAVQFASVDEIYPVDELIAEMEADGSIANYDSLALDAMKYDGHYVALPWALDIRTIWARTDILEAKGIEMPTTWDEFRAAAKAATGDGVYGVVASGGPGGVHWIATMAVNNGGGLFDAEGNAGLTTERTMEALEFLAGFAADGSLNPASAGYVTDDAIGSIARGESAFFLYNPGLKPRVGDAAEHVTQIPPLQGPHGDYGTINFVNNIMVYKQSENPQAALTFLRWWAENQIPLWTEGGVGAIPARKGFLEHEFFQSNEDLIYAAENYVPISKTMSAPVGGTFPALNTIDGDGFLRSLAEQLWQGVPAAEAVVPAQAHLVEILED